MHAQQHQAKVFLFGSLLSLILVGCGASVGKTIKVSDEQLSRYGTLSAKDAISALEIRVKDAKTANMPFLAPNYFREASEILNDAQKSADKKPKVELVSDVAKADAILDKGQTRMATVQRNLAKELAMKDQLDKDNVANVFPKDYEKSISELSSLIEKVELEKAENIDKTRIELIKMMQDLDVRTIQFTALHESDSINEDTRSNDGKDQAPATLAEALRVYQDAMNRIAQNPHDKETVRSAGTDALFAANHARYVNRRVLSLQNKFKKSIEPIALEEEKRLLDISTALGHNDLRDRPIDKQASELAKAAGEIVLGQQKSSQTIGAVSDQSKALEASLKQANDAVTQADAKIAAKDTLLSSINAQVAVKNAQLTDKDVLLTNRDAQLKVLNDRVAQLEEQNKSLMTTQTAKAQSKSKPKAKPKVPKTQPTSAAPH